MGLEAPSPASLARIFRQEGVARAEPSKRPRAAWRRFDPPRPQRLLAARRHRVRPGRRAQGGDLAGSRTTTGAWRWPGWSPRAMAGQAAIDVFDKGVAARGVPQRLLTDNGAALNPSRRGVTGRLVEHVRSLGVEPPAGRPYRPTTHGRQRALRPDPAPPPGPAAPGRLHRRAPGAGRPLRPHPATPSAPTRACPGASPGSRPGTPPRWPGHPDRATAPTPSPPAANPRATRPPGADRRTGAGPSPPAASAKPAITRNGRRPHRRHRVPGPPRPGRAPNHRDPGRHHHHLRPRPRPAS